MHSLKTVGSISVLEGSQEVHYTAAVVISEAKDSIDAGIRYVSEQYRPDKHHYDVGEPVTDDWLAKQIGYADFANTHGPMTDLVFPHHRIRVWKIGEEN